VHFVGEKKKEEEEVLKLVIKNGNDTKTVP
jgi:hypothetical protein